MYRPRAHRRLRRAVGAYLDGELAPATRAEVADHLSVCWVCSYTAETLRLLKRALTHCRDLAPASVAERRLRRFAQDIARRGTPPGGKPPVS